MGTARQIRLLNLLTGILVLQQVGSWSIIVPPKITAIEGSCVVVPCQTQHHSRVIWYQYHSVHYPVVYDGLHAHTVTQQFRGRTTVLGNSAEGNCTLMIDDVTTADNNIKVYVWINPDSKTNQRFYDQTVTIIVERKAPIISIQRPIIAGEMFHANCSLTYSCPFSSLSLQWNITMDLENSSLTVFNEQVDGKWLYRNTVYGLGSYQLHNAKIRCSAHFKTLITNSQQIALSILYKPVIVNLIVENKPVMEGGSIITECAAKSNPQPHTYSWLRRQTGQINEINSTQKTMSFSNIIRDTSLSCIAHNENGVGQSNWLDLDVQYVPAILPESSCNLIGEVLRCFCLAKASPNAGIHWTIDGNNTTLFSISFVSTNKNNVVSGEISGPAKRQTNVSCTAWNSLGNDTKQLFVSNLSKTSSLSKWLPALLFMGMASLFGAMLIYRKYFVNRSQDKDTQSTSCSPERNPDVDRVSCVYDNDFLDEMRRPTTAQHHDDKTTAPQREGKTLALSEV